MDNVVASAAPILTPICIYMGHLPVLVAAGVKVSPPDPGALLQAQDLLLCGLVCV